MGYRQPKVIKLSKHKNYIEIKRLYDEIDRLYTLLKKVKQHWEDCVDCVDTEGDTFYPLTIEGRDWYDEMTNILKNIK